MKIDPALVSGLPGLRAAYWPAGGLRLLEYFKGGECLAVLELSRDDTRGQVRFAIAGEIYQKGAIRPIGPFADGPPRKTGLSFEDWAVAQIKKMRELAEDRDAAR